MILDAVTLIRLGLISERAMLPMDSNVFDERLCFRRPGTWTCIPCSVIEMPVDVAVLCPLPSFLESLNRSHRMGTAKPAEE